MYKPPSSPSSILPPGNATCASLVIRAVSGPSPFSLCRNKISARASLALTQSSWKNSVKLGGSEERREVDHCGGGTTRKIMATAARRGSACNSDVSASYNGTKKNRTRRGGRYQTRGCRPYSMQSMCKVGDDNLIVCWLFIRQGIGTWRIFLTAIVGHASRIFVQCCRLAERDKLLCS